MKSMEHISSRMQVQKNSTLRKLAILEQNEAGKRLLTASLGRYYNTHRTNAHTHTHTPNHLKTQIQIWDHFT